MQKKSVLLAGGTGLIGKRMAQFIRQNGHELRLLTRKPQGEGQFFWNPATDEIDMNALQGVDTVINLAGAGIADKRWTPARKKELVESRVQSAAVLFRAIQSLTNGPKTYISTSAIGIYGNSGNDWMHEASVPADHNFMVQCCQQWEAAADRMHTLGLRTVKFRIGVVLAKEGGALAEIVKPLRFGLGTYFGDGQAWWSWVHRDDVCRAFVWATDNQSVEGVFNLVAPHPETGKALVKDTAQAMRQPAIFIPVPAVGLRLILGEMSAVVLNSNRVAAEKLLQAGFHFQWPQLKPALLDIFAPSTP